MRDRESGLRKFVQKFVLFGVGLFILIFGFSYIGSCYFKATRPPPINDAPWVVQTSSRVFFTQNYSTVNGTPTIKGYWMQDEHGYYHYSDKVVVFPPKLYGNVAVIRRTE